MKSDDSSTRFSLRRPQDGAVLVVVLLAMIGLLGMGLAGLYLTSGSIQMSSNINMRNQALYVAEGGIQVAKGILNRPAPIGASPAWQPDLNGMLAGVHSPLGATVATPSGYTDEIPGRAGTDATDPGCSGTSANGVSTRGAYLRDEDPPPAGFGCQTNASTAQPVYINCNYPPAYSSTDNSGNSLAYNATPPDPNNMSATPTQYMGHYTLFIRQDLAECRLGPSLGASYYTTDLNQIVVIRSEGTASDNRTKVVLEVTMSTNPNVQILSQGLATVCPAGAAGCDDNASVQQGITVGPPGAGGAAGSGPGGAGGTAPCTKSADCPSEKPDCCLGYCMTAAQYENSGCLNCGVTGCSDTTKSCCYPPSSTTPSCVSYGNDTSGTGDTGCGACGTNCKKLAPTTSCCPGANGIYSCVDETADKNNCGGCNIQCTSTQSCCASKCVDTTTDGNNCGQCGNTCSVGTPCCASQCCGGTNICCKGTCEPNPSCRIATIGVEGPWDGGVTKFDSWLHQLSHNCSVSSVDVSNTTLTMSALSGLNANVIILLDVIHSPADLAEKLYYVAHNKSSYYYGAGNGTNYTKLIAADPVGNPNRAPMRILSTTGANNEAQVLGTWVRGGGGLATTVGITCLDNERTFPNKVLQYATDPGTPSDPTTSFTPNNNNIVYLNSPPNVCVLNPVSPINGTWAWSGDTETGSSNYGFKRYPSNSALIPEAITHGVTGLEMQGMYIVWTALTDTLAHPSFSAYASIHDVLDSTEIDDPLGKKLTAPYLVGVAGEFGNGRLNVWGDEWITYDAVWDTEQKLYADVYWKNVVQWLGQCSLTYSDGGSAP